MFQQLLPHFFIRLVVLFNMSLTFITNTLLNFSTHPLLAQVYLCFMSVFLIKTRLITRTVPFSKLCARHKVSLSPETIF